MCRIPLWCSSSFPNRWQSHATIICNIFEGGCPFEQVRSHNMSHNWKVLAPVTIHCGSIGAHWINGYPLIPWFPIESMFPCPYTLLLEIILCPHTALLDFFPGVLIQVGFAVGFPRAQCQIDFWKLAVKWSFWYNKRRQYLLIRITL